MKMRFLFADIIISDYVDGMTTDTVYFNQRSAAQIQRIVSLCIVMHADGTQLTNHIQRS